MVNVIVYSTSMCPWCVKAKEYFRERGIKFTEYDINKDPARGKEMVKKSDQDGVPVIDIDGTIVIGFDMEEIEKALAKKK